MNVEGFTHRIVLVGDVKMHAVIGGNGPPLVLIHGFPQTWWAWRHMMPQLASRHTVVAVDLRGAGHSDKPQGGYDKASLAGDVHGVMTALGFDKYAVGGHDIGAMTALALALTHRDAVTRLTVLDASQPGWSRWVANSHEQKVWHFAFHMKRDLPGVAHPRARIRLRLNLHLRPGLRSGSASGRGHRGIRAVPQAARKLEGRA